MKTSNLQSPKVTPFNIADLQAQLNEQRKDRIGERIARAKSNKIAEARAVIQSEHAVAKKQISDMRKSNGIALGAAVVGIINSGLAALGTVNGVVGVVFQAVSLAVSVTSSVVTAVFDKIGASSAEKLANMKAALAEEKQLKIELERELKSLEDQDTDITARRDEAQNLARQLQQHHDRIADLTA